MDDVQERMSKLTEDQLQEIREAFAIYDKDGDGKISYRELGTVLRSLGLSPTEHEIIRFISRHDRDGDGTISFDEFAISFADKMRKVKTEEDVLDAFRVLDIEKSGTITVTRLRHVLQTLGDKLSDEEIQSMIEEADDDGDGLINYKDFVRIMFAKEKD
ncbi:hypothetical protein PVAND_009361 [Polypedilum vanderplanki]|uniref:EF-hand domain-containing protein n=1 Tax=Polypedilum vanderplanki TaxID=319348 RepID=A0A9J6CCX1_POLVA|nr:hypothetical protein PVAND_009361 [Polypedilum vanderplanki]